MTDETIDRRTTLKVLGGAGVAALAGAGTVTGHPLASGEENWEVSELESTIVDADPIRDEDPTLTGVLVLAGVNQNGTVAGLGRTVEGESAGFWWDPDEGYRAQPGTVVHAVDGDHIAGKTEGEGEVRAVVGHMDPESDSFFGEDPAFLPSLGGSYSAVYGIAFGDDETVAVGVSTTEDGEEQFVQWTTEETDDGTGDQPQQRTLRVHGTDETEWANYEITIDGTAEAVREGDERANPNDEVDPSDDGTVTIRGTVGGGVDTYRFSGEVTGWNEPAGARLTVDGEELDVGDGGDDAPDGEDGDDDDQPEQRTLKVHGTDEEPWANYEITIEGTAEAVREGDEVANASDEVTENDDGTVTITGTVSSGADTYLFTGEIADWNDPDGARITVDGEELS